MLEKAVKTIGVTVNTGKEMAPDALARLRDSASALALRVVAVDEATRDFAANLGIGLEHGVESDVLLALGGDGTMLHAIRCIDDRDIPLMGVNLGSLGFLTSIRLDHLERALGALAEGRYRMSRRTLIRCRLQSEGRDAGPEHRALNDIVIGWGESSRVVTLDVYIDGDMAGSYMSDGLIVSTPTGSTGHSLSAGGPILHPETPVFVLSEICPHTLSNRPLVVPDHSVVELVVRKSSKRQLLVIDGQDRYALGQGDSVRAWKDPAGVRFVHLADYNYFDLLRQKLNWRGSNVG